MRFDLPPGHDLAPRIEYLHAASNGGTNELDNLCLCHGHCNRLMGDATAEVKERMRRKAEAELLVTARQKRRA